jgi:succinate-semialdehyde dehydrogenase / glutarate-semialdehyde dehydrogenase
LNKIDGAVKAGARLLAGGTAPDRGGFYLEPAILADIDKSNPAYIQEVFGPVLLCSR